MEIYNLTEYKFLSCLSDRYKYGKKIILFS